MDRKTLNGGTFLLILNILLAACWILVQQLFGPGSAPDPELRRMALRSSGKGLDPNPFEADSLFAFDPNTLDMEGWRALGLTEEQAGVLLNYRKSGGRFYDTTELLKVYSIRKEHVEAWHGYMNFPDKREDPEKEEEERYEPEAGEKEVEEREGFEGFPFDPNQLPIEGWTRLGLSREQAKVIDEFREAGGTFWKTSDLLQLYVLDTALVRKWEPYIRIDREALKVAIDRADRKELEKLPGIGKVRAGRIIEYRKLLGGYRKKGQLQEVYGIPDSVLGPLMERVKVRGGAIDPIPIDTTAKRLMQHPYIDPAKAEAIVKHRKRYGAFEKKSELRDLDLLEAKEYRKIAPYLELPQEE